MQREKNMGNYENERLSIQNFQNIIMYYRYQHSKTLDPSIRMHIENLICDELDHLDQFLQRASHNINQQQQQQQQQPRQQQKQFSIEELIQYDGTNGKPTYAAVKGIVYDLSLEPTWGGGSHFGLEGGKDLTSSFESCHAAQQLLERS